MSERRRESRMLLLGNAAAAVTVGSGIEIAFGHYPSRWLLAAWPIVLGAFVLTESVRRWRRYRERMPAMAVTVRSQPGAVTSKPMAAFTMSLGPGDWKPGPVPAAGDLVMLAVIRPERAVIGPSGWTALPDGRAFWKIWGNDERYTATFHAEDALDWEVKGYAVAAGSYSLPPAVA